MKIIVTAEHTRGRSVSHPCTGGVWNDPTDGWEFAADFPFHKNLTEAEREALVSSVEREAWQELVSIAEAMDHCHCRKCLRPVGEWFGSVALNVEVRE